MDNLLSLTTFSKAKMKIYLSRKGYAYAGKDQLIDTVTSRFDFRKSNDKENKNADTIIRSFYRSDVGENFFITYQTTSLPGFKELVAQFKKAGFYSNQPDDSLPAQALLFQHNDITLRTYFTTMDSTKNYCLQVQKKTFPHLKDINYADDLLAFTSHESLVYFFGKNNVKNDIYYFSVNEIVRCSVLFLNTSRQVVFIWKDEINKCNIAHLLFGGQQKLESAIANKNFIAENSWVFKSGIRAGMSLFELRRLNGKDFKFYGGNSAYSGSVLKDNNGKLNFKNENIILGCMNCMDTTYAASTVINADDALAEARIFFVLSIALYPEQ